MSIYQNTEIAIKSLIIELIKNAFSAYNTYSLCIINESSKNSMNIESLNNGIKQYLTYGCRSYFSYITIESNLENMRILKDLMSNVSITLSKDDDHKITVIIKIYCELNFYSEDFGPDMSQQYNVIELSENDLLKNNINGKEIFKYFRQLAKNLPDY